MLVGLEQPSCIAFFDLIVYVAEALEAIVVYTFFKSFGGEANVILIKKVCLHR